MTAPVQRDPQFEAARRKRALRTAWVVGIIAFAVYAGFILSGVLSA